MKYSKPKIVAGNKTETHYWSTHSQNIDAKDVSLEKQYQLDIDIMKDFEILLAI